MKIAIVTDCLSRNAGGLFHSVRRLAHELQCAGVRVSVLGVADRFTQDDLHHWSPLETYVAPLRGPRALGFAPELTRTLIAETPDLINVHGLWKYTSVATLRAAAAVRCPYLVHPHGMLDPWAVQNSRWKKRLAEWAYERRHLRGAGCLRALNRSEAASIRAYGLRNPICIIPNAIDLPPSPEPPLSDRREPNRVQAANEANPFSTGRRVLLYLGRIHPKKGLENLIQAWAALQGRPHGTLAASDWQLAIAGWDQGGHETVLQSQVAEHALGDRVVFLGPRFDAAKAACFRHCDAFVLPSFSEGLPMTVLEAWSYAKPVVMTPQCNLPEGFTSGAALSIDASVTSITAGLQKLFEMDDSQRQSMGNRGFELVSRDFTWPRVAHQLQQVYDWLLGGGPLPDCVVQEGPGTGEASNGPFDSASP